MTFEARYLSERRYNERKENLGYFRSPIIRSAFDVIGREYRTGFFDSREPILNHLLDVAETLQFWQMPDDVIAAGLCHKINELPADLSPLNPLIFAYNRIDHPMRGVLPEALSAGSITADNYQNYLLSLNFDPSTDDTVIFNAHMLRAADQLCSLRASLTTSWDLDIDKIPYSWISMSTAAFLGQLNMDEGAGEIFDIVYKTLDEKSFDKYYSMLYGSAFRHREMLSFKDDTSSIIEDTLRAHFLEVASPGLLSKDPDYSVFSRIKSVHSFAGKAEVRGRDAFTDDIGFRIVINGNFECDNAAQFAKANDAKRKAGVSDREIRSLSRDYDLAREAIYNTNSLVGDLAEQYGWIEITSRYRDYVNTPRGNKYQAMQRSFVTSGDEPLRFEIQIRTSGMHEWAEWGGASHSHYKEGSTYDVTEDYATDRFNRFLELKEEAKRNIYGFSYHPGSILEGPYSMTPIPGRIPVALDLAYAISESWGLRGAQFYRYSERHGRLVECTAGTQIDNGEIIRVKPSDVIEVSEERMDLVGTDNARMALARAIAARNRVSLDSIESEGQAMYLGLVSSAESSILNGSNSRGTEISRDSTSLILSEQLLLQKLNKTSISDMFFTLSRNESYQREVESAIHDIGVVCCKEPQTKSTSYSFANTALAPQILNILLKSIPNIGSLEISCSYPVSIIRITQNGQYSEESLRPIQDQIEALALSDQSKRIAPQYRDKRVYMTVPKGSIPDLCSAAERYDLRFTEATFTDRGGKITFLINTPNRYSIEKLLKIFSSVKGAKKLSIEM